MSAKLTAVLALGDETGAAIAARLPGEENPAGAAALVASLLTACQSGQMRGRLRVTIDEVTPVAASGTITCVVASLAAGDKILIEDMILTCVVGTAGTDQYSKDTSNAACGTSLKNAINANPTLKRLGVATDDGSGTVTFTLRDKGTGGNLVRLRKVTATAAGHVLQGLANTVTSTTLSGGKNAANKPTATITCVFANTDEDDTVSIGAVTLTAKASGASGENQFNLGTTDATMAANLLAKIQAHSSLLGILTAAQTANTGLITLTFTCDPRVAMSLGVLASSDSDGLVVTQPSAASVAYSNSLVTKSFNLGAGD